MSDNTPSVGRPTLYKSEYCQQLIDHMSEGLSFESFAAVANCCIDTIYEWAKVYPEFSEAKKKGSAKSRLVWERMAIDGAWNSSGEGSHKNLNNAAWIFNMKNRFGWRDRIESEVTTDSTITVVLDSDEAEV